MFGNRPTFGGTSGFGGFGTNTSTTAFGSSSFGRPAFGTPQTTASSTPFGSGTSTNKTSLFGQTTPATGGLFGSSQSTGFGSTGTSFGSGGGGGLFGTSNTQTSTSGGLFGSNASNSTFNTNQNQTRPFSFGTSTTSSGAGGTSLFGTNNNTAGGNLFSSSLGQSSSGTVIKYNPVSGTDTMTRGGATTNIQTKIEVITAMKEYENRSLEELRVEDYLAGRKGPQQGQQPQQQQGFGFGQIGQQNKFGMNQPATSSNWLSGSNTGSGGLFGTKPAENKPLFGTSQSTGFGTSTSGGGLFGSSNPAPFGQSTTAPSNTGFSFGQSNPNKGFSFGQTTSAAPLFGQPTATQAGTTFGSSGFNFGNQANQQQGGLFGAQKPAFGSTSTNTSLFSNKPTNTGFGGFGGAASAASPFGTTNTSTSGGLFGSANQNKTGFSLGTSNTGFGTGTSTFGSGGIFSANNNQPKPGGLTFGSSGGFGTNTASTGFSFNQPSTGGGLFGNTQGTTGGGLFGNTNTGLNTGNAFGSSGFGMNTMQPNLMSGGLNFNSSNNNLMNPNVVNNNNNNINNLIKALTHNPFGISSLLKDVSTPTGKADELLNSPTSSANNANATKSSVSDKTPTYVLPSSSAIHIRPKPIGHNRLTNLTDDSKKSFLFAGLDEKNENSPDDPFKIKPFPSVKRLNLKVFKNKNSANNSNSSGTGQNTTTNSIINGNLNPGTPTSPGFQDTPTHQGTLTPLHDNSPTPDIIKGRSNIKRLQIPNKNQFNDTLAELNVMNKLKSTDAVADLDVSDFNKENNVSLFDPPSIDELHDLPEEANTSTTPHPAGIKLARIGYYTIPSMEDLKEMVDTDGNCFVENFTVGRYGYGNICFQGITNVIGLDLDSFIFIVRKEVEVYPEGVTKPTVGEELNKPAFITLDCVWPVDKTTHEVIKSQERLDAMGWAQYLERQCLKMESSFVEYRPETGSWVFKVKHFSKYGLQDDESESTVATPQQAAAEGVGAKVPPPTQKPMPQTSGAELAAKTPNSLANFSTNIPLFGGRASQGPPAVALTSPPLLSSAPPQYGIDSTPSSTRRNLKVFLDGSTTDLGEEEIFITGEESNNCVSLCPLSPSAERLTLSTKAPARAIQSLKSQLFFSDFDSEVTNEDDYKGTSLPYPREKSEKRERELFGEEFLGPSEDCGRAPVVPVKSSSKKLFLGAESRLDTSRGDVSNLSSVPMETGSVRGKKTYSEPQREERENSEPETITSKAKLREPRTEYQLLKSIPDPHFELGRETMVQLEYKVPYEGSQAFNFSKGTADAGAFMGRSFRVGWGPSLTLVHVGPALLGSSSEPDHDEEESVDGGSEEPHYLFDTGAGFSELKRSEIPRSIKTERFDIMIEKLHIRSQVPEMLGESSLQIGPMLEACLQNVLRCSIINIPDSVKDLTMDIGSSSAGQQPMSKFHTSVFPAICHYFAPEEGINLLHQLVLTASQIDDNEYRETKLATVFELCAALWGRLDFYSPDIDGESEYALEHARKEALSVWLEEVSSESVEMEAERALENDSDEAYVDAVFSHLTARQISRACDVCLDKGDNHLALLLSQSCMSDDIPRQIMKEQLTNWAWSGVDTHMSASRLALYALVGGQAIHESSQGKINTCLGLDWRRCLAVLMWYICPTTSSISEVLKEYEKASGLISSKEPPYCEDPKPIYLANQPLPENIKVNYDVCFQLLKLYVDRSHSLETLLETSSITSDPLDVTTSWLLWCVLQSLGYTLLPPAKIEALNTSMAALLESHGSWHWAAFVILFLKDEEKRKREVLELLTRHLLVEGEEGRKDPFYVEKEHFILKELKLPEPWINKAKAIRAKSLELVDEETWYLIKAGEYNEAHKLILETIAPNAIINEDHEFLLSYLNEFEDEIIERVVDWQNGGAIYRAYLEVVQQVNELRESQHPTVSKVERLRPRLMALCLRLNNLTSSTAVHRLSISEMSRLVVSVLRAILSEDPDGVRVLAQQVTSLPLTHECALEELNHITHQYLTTLSHHDAVSMEIS